MENEQNQPMIKFECSNKNKNYGKPVFYYHDLDCFPILKVIFSSDKIAGVLISMF